jgi:hypothetical protein
MIAPTDPDTLLHSNIAAPSLVPPVSPWIFELFPLPGNIYESTCNFYDSTTDLTQGDFVVVLAFAAAYSQPTVVHKCQDLQEFQTAHPLAIVCFFPRFLQPFLSVVGSF